MFRNWSANVVATHCVAGLLSFLAISNSASGAIFTTPQVQNFSFNDLNSSANLNFNGFNGNLGTLTIAIWGLGALGCAMAGYRRYRPAA